jgi:hypothetical protein
MVSRQRLMKYRLIQTSALCMSRPFDNYKEFFLANIHTVIHAQAR